MYHEKKTLYLGENYRTLLSLFSNDSGVYIKTNREISETCQPARRRIQLLNGRTRAVQICDQFDKYDWYYGLHLLTLRLRNIESTRTVVVDYKESYKRRSISKEYQTRAHWFETWTINHTANTSFTCSTSGT
jgi:hypothetical protein